MAAIFLVQICVYAGLLFVPTFIIALGMLRAPLRAFILSSWFSVGAVSGGFLTYALAGAVLVRRHSDDVNRALTALFVVAGAAACGVLALLVLNKISKYPPWRRN